jgi:hypothetical protein
MANASTLRRTLSLVSTNHSIPADENYEEARLAFKQSFQGWLTVVPKEADKPNLPAPISTEAFIQVELATLRESRNHRCWPTEVVAKFLAADVISR